MANLKNIWSSSSNLYYKKPETSEQKPMFVEGFLLGDGSSGVTNISLEKIIVGI